MVTTTPLQSRPKRKFHMTRLLQPTVPPPWTIHALPKPAVNPVGDFVKVCGGMWVCRILGGSGSGVSRQLADWGSIDSVSGFCRSRVWALRTAARGPHWGVAALCLLEPFILFKFGPLGLDLNNYCNPYPEC